MNETLNNLKTRRSIRSYLPKQVEKDLLEQVLEAGTFAPTGGGKQVPLIVAVQDPATVRQLSHMNAQVIGNGVIDAENARAALDRMEIDSLGLDSIDRLLLTAMIRNYNGGPVGLETIAAAIGEEAVTIEDVYEPYLMQIGFLSRTPRGRIVTPAGYRHLGIDMPGQQKLDL